MNNDIKEKYKEWGRRGGAPKKNENLKRTNFVGIHLTKDEKAKLILLVKKTKMKQSDLVRKLIFDSSEKIISDLLLAEAMQIKIELRKIGVNINQMAKKMNAEDTFVISDKHRDQFQFFQSTIQSILDSNIYLLKS